MDKSKNQYNPDYAVHPGDFIVEKLRHYNRFWHLNHLEKSWLLALISSKATIDSFDALRLAELFGTSEELWLNLQTQWDERNKTGETE